MCQLQLGHVHNLLKMSIPTFIDIEVSDQVRLHCYSLSEMHKNEKKILRF